MKRRPKTCIERLEPRVLLSAWNTVDGFQYPNGEEAVPSALAVDRAGNVYAAGGAVDGVGLDHGIIRERTINPTTGTASWNGVEDLPNAAFHAVAVNQNTGDVYACGSIVNGPTNYGIIVEKPAGQTSFSVIHTNTIGSVDSGITVDAGGSVYIVGDADENSQEHWIVQKLAAGAPSIVTVDDGVYSSTVGAEAHSLAIVASGPSAGLYVVGTTQHDDHWLVRRSTDGGNTWSMIDDFQYPVPPGASGNQNDAIAVAADTAGNVYVVGQSDLLTGVSNPTYPITSHALVRELPAGSTKWSVIYDSTSATTGQQLQSVVAGPDGHVYINGTVFSVNAQGQEDSRLPQQETVLEGAAAAVNGSTNWNWSVLDQYSGSFSAGVEGLGITIDSSGNLYASGNGMPQNGQIGSTIWLVRSDVAAVASTLKSFGTTVSGVATYSLSAVVGSFTDSSPKARLSNYSATLNWGDGGSSTGIIAFKGSTKRYDVSGGHTYAVAGTYTISILINDSAGPGTTIKSSADISPPGPSVQITGPGGVNEGGSYSLQLSSIDAGGQAIMQWTINWGDGSIQQLPGASTTASHVYDDGPASELIRATATDAKGFSATAALPVMVQDVAPTAILSATAPASAGEFGTARFSSVFDPSVADTQAGFHYSFDWDNDGIFEIVNSAVPTAPIPANYLSTPGPHVVVGRVADKDGRFTDYSTMMQVGTVGGGTAALNAASQIAASLFFSSLPVQTNTGGNILLGAGDWLAYRVDFGKNGVRRAKMQLSAIAARAGVKVQLRLDDPDGQIVASFSGRAAGSRGQLSRSQNVTGIHDLYLEVVGGQAQVNWFSFVPIVAKHKRPQAGK